MTKQRITLKEIVTSKLEKLVSELHVDFSALAFYDPINLEFRWRLAIGSLNNRFKGIVVRQGKGVCGWVLRTKREFVIGRFPEELQDDYDYLEYPILIIEELKSAVAVPLFRQRQLIGVLLIGQRTNRDFDFEQVEFSKRIAEEIVQVYTEERSSGKSKYGEKKDIKKGSLSIYFVEKKRKYGDRLQIILLDQRVTLLTDKAQQTLISILEFLLDAAFLKEVDMNVKVIIERKSEQQLAVQIDTDKPFELSQDIFSYLADEVRTLKGSIEMVCDEDKTILTMNFFLSMLISDGLWTV